MQFIKLDAVKSLTGLSRSSIYQSIKEGQFPAQIKIGSRSVVWVASEIEDWMASCIDKRISLQATK